LKILNYALTLEHLESAFYNGALEKFNNDSFSALGVDRGRFQQMYAHYTLVYLQYEFISSQRILNARVFVCVLGGVIT
jgi:hypothetical protein